MKTLYWFTSNNPPLQSDTDGAVAYGALQMIFCDKGVPPEWIGKVDPANLPCGYTDTTYPVTQGAIRLTCNIDPSVVPGVLDALTAAGFPAGGADVGGTWIDLFPLKLTVQLPIVAQAETQPSTSHVADGVLMLQAYSAVLQGATTWPAAANAALLRWQVEVVLPHLSGAE